MEGEFVVLGNVRKKIHRDWHPNDQIQSYFKKMVFKFNEIILG